MAEMDLPKPTLSNCLVFAVNGERFELSSIHPSTTLLEFLRSHTPFKGAKLSCGEGLSFFFSSLCLNVLSCAPVYMHTLAMVAHMLLSFVGFPSGIDWFCSLCLEFPFILFSWWVALILLSRFSVYLDKYACSSMT